VPLDLLPGIAQEVDIKKIRSPRHVLRDEYGQIDELLLSISQKGLIQPIVVRPVEDDELFEVVAGHRRLKACKMLDVKKIPCYVMDLDDKEAFELAITENLQRKTLNPLEEAKAFKNYTGEFGYGSETELARRIGKSPSYVSRRIALLKLPKEVQLQLLRGAKVGLTQELEALDGDDMKAVTSLITEAGLTRGDIRQVVRLMKEDSRAEPTKPAISYYVAAEVRQRSLVRAIGKFIASLEVCMMRLDDIVNSLDESEWVVRDILTQNRSSIHGQIDALMKLKRKIQRELPPTSLEAPSHPHIRQKAAASIMHE